ncbi:MAG: hypothetical protein WKF82_08305 [Nocardioidaceae bacterium]
MLQNPLSRMGFLARTSAMIEDLIKLAEAEPDPRSTHHRSLTAR